MPLTEKNPGALNRVRMRVRALGEASTRARLHQVLAAANLKDYADGFVQSRDPYGRPWKALTSRDGQPLRKHGHMGASPHVNQKPGGYSLTVDQGHPKTHQRGMTIHPVAAAALRFVVRGAVVFAKKVTVPQRMIVPTRARGLGLWAVAMKRDASDFIRRLLTGGET